ncbi:unnamed protein product [Ceutorhynchus assimilis]|uniref:Uncharacterized protein n=1 Tax=Ceutorhynchus assimilis TaxID=467358 RepID=A0A9N9MRA3_9CUCU|nr:unnamed protein product [Ceutorhynchus assimilis]
MWTLFGVWTIILVGVSAIRVPTHWGNEQQETIKRLVPDYNGYRSWHPSFQRRMFENVQENLPQQTIIYNPLQPQIMQPSNNGLHVPEHQKNLPRQTITYNPLQPSMSVNLNNGFYIPEQQKLYKNVPSLLNPRYTNEDLYLKKLWEHTQKLLRSQRPNLISNENLAEIKSSPIGNLEKQAELNKIAMDYNSRAYNTDSFRVSASTLSPLILEPTTKKEPVFSVTEGYRNVLVQGANSKKYNMENQGETKQILSKEKPQRKRKVTKIYKIHNGGWNNNLVQAEPIIRIPQIYKNENRRNYVIKNYRDDDLHEPKDDKDLERDDEENERVNEEDDNSNEEETKSDDVDNKNDTSNEEDEEDEETEDKEVPHSEHADPIPVPTKPIYPGEGQWAKPGLKHRVHNSQHKFFKPQEVEQKPSGYNVFEDLEHYFENQRDNFGQTFGANSNLDITTPSSGIFQPNPVNPIVVYDPFTESSSLNATIARKSAENVNSEEAIVDTEEETIVTANTNPEEAINDSEENLVDESDVDSNEEIEESEENDEDEEGFVPLQLYSQVRKSENEEHEPYNPLEHGRLKEIIKDSKVQTVYTEEGYEDSAYDHAGHEKKAEKDQGYSEFERDKLGKDNDEKNDNKKENSEETAVLDKSLDSIGSDTVFPTNNNFITTQEVKTTQIKDKNNGDMQLEIENEVKVISQPNNSTKTHRYIKIYPKISMEIAKGTSTTEKSIEIDKAVHQEINNMDESTTESSTVSIIEAITKKTNNRKKRSSGTGFEDVIIDTDFIDKINHKFAPKPEIDINKYPYYTMPNLNDDSPLRYAENMNNIPVKTEGELSFYKMADNRHECDEIPQNIDPIPEHVKNAPSKKEEVSDEEEEEDSREKRDVGPRIQLGDKIDCLKARYFGENPLDSPFFKEETVGPVRPIFTELAPHHNEIVSNKNERKFEISKDNLLVIENDKAESIKVPLVTKPTPSPLVSLMTTPKYTLKLTPKNIYDQIKLLDHLATDETKIINKVEQTNQNSTKEESRESKTLVEVNDNITKEVDQEPTLEPEALRRKLRPRRPNYQVFDVNKYLTTTPFSLFDTVSTTVLPKYKVFSEVFYKDEIKPNEQLNVFADVQNNIKNSNNVELPLEQSRSDFAEPNAVTVSSVDLPRTTQAPSVRVKKFQTDSSSHKNNIPEHNIPKSYNVQKHYVKTPGNQKVILPEINGFVNNQMSHKRITSNPTIVDPILPTNKPRKIKRRRKPTTTTTSTTLRTTTNIRVPEQTVPKNHQPFVIDFIEEIQQVIGLVPPQEFEYRTLPEEDVDENTKEKTYDYPKPVNSISEPPSTEVPMNNYYFTGLKPPSNKRARPYSEYTNINRNFVRRRGGREESSRKKREAARPAYADLSRNRGRQNEGLEKSPVVDDVDDYVPHRPKNYHYDEATGKIVYHTKPAVVEKEEELEYEEIEVPDTPGVYLERAEDATHPTPEKVTTKELLATATPPPDGKGLLDFVVKLKNNPNYKFIPDPTTPKPGTVTTTEAFVTVDPKSTDPPEFLSILSKVKANKNYKPIEDPKENKNKVKSTTAEPESEEEYVDEEDEEDAPRHVQNSPGGQTQDLGNIQIFDIGDYLPKMKSFTPRTTIDYSKYKTIERPHSKSREKEKEEEEEEVRRPSFNRGGQQFSERNIEEKESIERPTIHYKKEPVSTTTTTTTTTEKIIQFRRGTRPSTQRTTNSESTEQTTTRRSRRPSGTTKKPTTSAEDMQTTEKVARVYPENYSTERPYSDQHDKAKRVYRRRPVRIRYTTERDSEEEETIDKIVRRSLDIEANEQPEFEEIYTEIKDEIIDDDDDDDASESKQNVEIIDTNYDRMQKHGGNYKKETKEDVKESGKVEILNQKYDKTAKDGGNYRKIPDDDVEIVNYDKNEKHGGNYRKPSEEEQEDIEDTDNERETNLDQNVQPNNDATIERNFNPQQITPKGFETKNTRKIKIRRRPTTTTTQPSKSVPRLTDVVPKPDHFYSDPQLPRQINNLGSEKPDLASEELSEVTENGDVAGSEKPVSEGLERPHTRRRRIKLRRRNFDIENSTKKPLYIKDPSKRLYYYVPV